MNVSLDDLRFARRLLDQRVPLDAATIRRIVDHAIDLTVRFLAQEPREPAEALDMSAKNALTREEIEEALEKGRRDAEAVRRAMDKGGYIP